MFAKIKKIAFEDYFTHSSVRFSGRSTYSNMEVCLPRNLYCLARVCRAAGANTLTCQFGLVAEVYNIGQGVGLQHRAGGGLLHQA
jgi:hypothetical protein